MKNIKLILVQQPGMNKQQFEIKTKKISKLLEEFNIDVKSTLIKGGYNGNNNE